MCKSAYLTVALGLTDRDGDVKKRMDFKAFKSRIAEELINPYLRQREKEASDKRQKVNQEKRTTRGERERFYPATAVGVLEDQCYFTETCTSGAHCFVCFRLGNLEGNEEHKKVRTGCSNCKKAFHPNCFTAYHLKGSLGEAGNAALAQRLARIDVGVDCNGKELKTTNKPVSGFPLLADLEIPHTPKVPLRRRRSRAEMELARGIVEEEPQELPQQRLRHI